MRCACFLLYSDIFCRFHRGGVFAFLVGAGLEVQESCLFIVVVEFLEYTLFVAFSECICRDCLESVTASWLVSTLLSIHFLHSGVVNLKNLFLRLSVLQSISGIFSRFFLLYCTWIFPFPHNISSFFCSGPYYYVCIGKFSFVFPSVSSAVVACFCTKLFGICTKQNIFCTKTGGNSSMFFLDLPYFLFRLPDFFGRSLSFWVKESGFLVYLSVF